MARTAANVGHECPAWPARLCVRHLDKYLPKLQLVNCRLRTMEKERRNRGPKYKSEIKVKVMTRDRDIRLLFFCLACQLLLLLLPRLLLLLLLLLLLMLLQLFHILFFSGQHTRQIWAETPCHVAVVWVSFLFPPFFYLLPNASCPEPRPRSL